MTEDNQMPDEFQALKPIQNTKIAPAQGIAAIALNMALKYYDISTVQDGTLYQQYKLEGKNMRPFHLDHVFETAIQIEKHLVTANDRIAAIIIDALEVAVEDDKEEETNNHGE